MTVPFVMLALCSGLADCMSSPLYAWFPVASAGALAMFAIFALITALSPFIGRGDLRTWAKIKMYEVLMSLVLIIAFLLLVALIGNINFLGIFKGAGLVPSYPVNCLAAPSNDFYTLSLCDLDNFNSYIDGLNRVFFAAGINTAMAPYLNVTFSIPIGAIGEIGSDQAFQLMPTEVNKLLGGATGALYTAYVLNQVQLYLLASSLMLFSLFMALGLIARVFVITRSFGGAMIAFGMGIGLIFPLLVCMTYGFIGVSAQPYYHIFAAGMVASFASSLIPTIVSAAAFVTLFAVPETWTNLLIFAGFVAAGIIFVPILNFTLLDVFIRDFSSAVGERVDFLSMLTRLV